MVGHPYVHVNPISKVSLLFLYEYCGVLVISFSLLFPTGFIHSLRISWFIKCVKCHVLWERVTKLPQFPLATHSTILYNPIY